AVTGMSLPSILIISLIAQTLLNIRGNSMVISIFLGIRACVVVLIFWAGFRMSKKAIIDKTSYLYTLGMIVGLMLLKIHPIIMIILAGVIGIITNKPHKELQNDNT
ncbi:MAG: chromate transporter, partial [Halanaerobiaceae bacterium]